MVIVARLPFSFSLHRPYKEFLNFQEGSKCMNLNKCKLYLVGNLHLYYVFVRACVCVCVHACVCAHVRAPVPLCL